MNAQHLKKSILQLAVQGKLVEQRTEEGTAKELLAQIKNEKEQLIKDKKIKKEKTEEKLCEVPFEIPNTWIWTRLGDIFYNKSGLSYKKGDLDIVTDDMVRVFRGGNILELEYMLKDDDVMISRPFVKEDLFLRKNMLITPAVTSLEHIGKMARIEKDIDDTVVGGFVLMLIPYVSNDILSRYLLYALSSHYHRSQCRNITNKSGQAFYNLSREKLMNFYVPIPPLAEQERIVAKIEEILPYIEQYDKAYTKLEIFNKKFPEDMKKSILQMAMQGKLVEQRPEEGTAEELYHKIITEKERFIEEGKIKKEKSFVEIAEDEIPFEIPENWKWVRFYDVIEVATNLVHSSDYQGFMHIAPDNIEKKSGRLLECRTVEEDKVVSPNHLFKKGQIIYSKIRPLLRKAVIAPFDGLCSADMYPLNTVLDKQYVLYYLLSDCFNLQVAEICSNRVKMPKINQVELGKTVVPLPPLAEQKRIVEKLEQILPYCDQLMNK